MRKINVLTFVSLDGVMQAPGGPEEDTNNDFKLGGWTVPYFDEFLGQEMTEEMGMPFDLLLGRRTYDIFASYWPHHPEEGAELNRATKYVASNTKAQGNWEKSVFLNGNVAEKVRQLKQEPGPDLQVHGSAVFLQTLLANDLVDELWLKIFPVVLGKGKRLFDNGAIPAAFKLTDSKTSPSGVMIAKFRRAGEVQTGTF